MLERAYLRVQHLRHLTDRNGLLRGGGFREPDGFSGYSTLDNGLALRVATRLNDLGLHDDASDWALIYLRFLFQACRVGRGFSAGRDALGHWSEETLSAAEHAQVARGLAAASAGTLPGVAIGRADALWAKVLPTFSNIACPRAAANWLIAIAERPRSEWRNYEEVADRLAGLLLDERLNAHRADDWMWFDSHLCSGDGCLPHGLWAAYSLLGQPRLARAAERATQFFAEQLFVDGVYTPVGTSQGWARHRPRPLFDQVPADVAATVELFTYAARVTGDGEYAGRAAAAHAWFTGANVLGIHMLDDTTGGVYDALSEDGHAPGQGATAIVSFLLSATALRSLETGRTSQCAMATTSGSATRS